MKNFDRIKAKSTIYAICSLLNIFMVAQRSSSFPSEPTKLEESWNNKQDKFVLKNENLKLDLLKNMAQGGETSEDGDCGACIEAGDSGGGSDTGKDDDNGSDANDLAGGAGSDGNKGGDGACIEAGDCDGGNDTGEDDDDKGDDGNADAGGDGGCIEAGGCDGDDGQNVSSGSSGAQNSSSYNITHPVF